MYHSISRVALFLVAWSLSTLAYADGQTHQITGQTCKQHMQNGVLSQVWTDVLASNSQITSYLSENENASTPRQVPIGTIAGLDVSLTTSIGVRNAAEHMTQFIAQCERYCAGLRGTNGNVFNCTRLGEASSDQLSAFIQSDEHLADSAVTELSQTEIDALFADEDTSVATAEDPQNVAPEITVEAETPVREGYIFRDSLFESGEEAQQTTAVRF